MGTKGCFPLLWKASDILVPVRQYKTSARWRVEDIQQLPMVKPSKLYPYNKLAALKSIAHVNNMCLCTEMVNVDSISAPIISNVMEVSVLELLIWILGHHNIMMSYIFYLSLLYCLGIFGLTCLLHEHFQRISSYQITISII